MISPKRLTMSAFDPCTSSSTCMQISLSLLFPAKVFAEEPYKVSVEPGK